MELANEGDLSKYIKKNQVLKHNIPLDLIWLYFIQALLAINALHAKSVIHRVNAIIIPGFETKELIYIE